jgi:hypothetical protein
MLGKGILPKNQSEKQGAYYAAILSSQQHLERKIY